MSTRKKNTLGIIERARDIPLLMKRMKPMHDAVNIFSSLQCRTLGKMISIQQANRYILIDDNPMDTVLLEQKFLDRDCSLEIIQTGHVSWVKENCPYQREKGSCVIFIDLQIPGTDGREIAQKLREQEKDDILIALTSTRPDDNKELFNLFEGVLLKPLSGNLIDMLLRKDK